MNILVLGGHGFVGRNVVDILNVSGHKVTPLSRRDGLDLTDEAVTERFFREIAPDVIINCAAKVGSLHYVTQEAAEVISVNLLMLLNMYKAIQKVKPGAVIINPVANCVYPGNLHTYVEDDIWSGKVHQSVLSFGSTRRVMLALSECYSMQYGLRSINFLVPNMYGPFDSTDPNKAHALNALISKVVKIKNQNEREIEVWGSGKAIREWLFAKDFGRIVLEALHKMGDDNFNQPVNIAQNNGLSVRELINIIIDETGFEGKVIWNRDMPDGAPCKIMDNKEFRKLFPDFGFTMLAEGIKETGAYYESIYPY